MAQLSLVVCADLKPTHLRFYMLKFPASYFEAMPNNCTR